mgnify:CR=1 FL=1
MIVHWYAVITRANPFTVSEFTNNNDISNIYLYVFIFAEFLAPQITESITIYLMTI